MASNPAHRGLVGDKRSDAALTKKNSDPSAPMRKNTSSPDPNANKVSHLSRSEFPAPTLTAGLECRDMMVIIKNNILIGTTIKEEDTGIIVVPGRSPKSLVARLVNLDAIRKNPHEPRTKFDLCVGEEALTFMGAIELLFIKSIAPFPKDAA